MNLKKEFLEDDITPRESDSITPRYIEVKTEGTAAH